MSKRKLEAAKIYELVNDPDYDLSEEPMTKIQKLEEQADKKENKVWRNKQRTLVFCSRGTTDRYRHLMNDLRTLLPHSKKEMKLDQKEKVSNINQICDLKDCNNCIYLEMRKHTDCYMWIARTPEGPSARCLVENVHTMGELKMIGNCLKGSRPLVLFDKNFDTEPQYRLMKELFSQVFGTPKGHPKSKPFFDHIFSFFIVDKRIWFRNFQIVFNSIDKKTEELDLVEIGPRFCLNIIRIFGGSFGGPTLYQNGSYISPNEFRAKQNASKANKYVKRVQSIQKRNERMQEANEPIVDERNEIFE